MSDIYALYLTSYLGTMNGSGTLPIPDTGGSRELQAIAYGIEDAMAYKSSCAGNNGPARKDDEDEEACTVGIRERWDLLQRIELNEAPEPPTDEDDE